MTTTRDLIVTHNTDRMRQHPQANYRTFLLLYHAQSGLGQHPPREEIGEPLFAHISVGRWCVMCDICRCAVVAEPDDPWFCCPACGSGGKWRPVIFPDPDQKEEIERILLMRPGFRSAAPSRSWFFGETPDDLRQENLDHGDPVDRQPALKPVGKEVTN